MSSKKRNQREIQFLEKTLYPILEAMSPNITDLKYRHGNMEFGKDFTFSYTNPLNQRINVGIQAKWGDVTGKAAEVKDITSQVDLAFTVPYRNKPNDPHFFVNELYIVCSGKFTNNAIEAITRALGRKYNVFFLQDSDIKQLEMHTDLTRRDEAKLLKARIREELEVLKEEISGDLESKSFSPDHFSTDTFDVLRDRLIPILPVKTFNQIDDCYEKVEALRFQTNIEDMTETRYREALDAVSEAIEALK